METLATFGQVQYDVDLYFISIFLNGDQNGKQKKQVTENNSNNNHFNRKDFGSRSLWGALPVTLTETSIYVM